jgi:hypothetical protein
VYDFHCDAHALAHCWLCQVQGAVFDLPEEIARDLLSMELPPGNTITKVTKVTFAAWYFSIIAIGIYSAIAIRNLCDDTQVFVWRGGISIYFQPRHLN